MSNEKLNNPQALRPPYFPALVTLDPAEHYHGGIPIRAVEGDLQGIVPAWGRMGVGDKVEVFWGNPDVALWSKILELDSELNKDVSFTLPKAHVLEGDATPVFYRISQKNQVPEDSIPVLTLLVKLTRPGEYDDIPGDDGHSDLKFTLSHDEVDEQLPDEGVTMSVVPYRNLTRYDRILARWGSQQVVHVVTPEQAENPTAHPITVVFSRKIIETAGDGPRVAVAFQVIDRCGNYPDERAPWSAQRYVLVDLGGNRLNEPKVLVNGLPTERIDLAQLGDDDVIVRAYTPKEYFNVGDEIAMTWVGIPAQGPQIIVGPLEQTVEFVDFNLDFPIPNAAVKAIAKGSASISYIRRRSGEQDRPSKNASITVVGDISQLAAPTVDEAPDGTLPSDTTLATVNIPWYPGRKASDLVNLIWVAQAPGGGTVYYDDPQLAGDVAENQPIRRSVRNEVILWFKGLSVKVYYVVTDSETALLSVRESLPFMMQVSVTLPVATFLEATGAQKDQLNPNTIPKGATVVIPAAALLQEDDHITVTVEGKTATRHQYTVSPVDVGKELTSINISHARINDENGGEISLSYKIARQAGGMDGPSNPSVYDVRNVIGRGVLSIFGARFQHTLVIPRGASRLLSTFNAETGQPVAAEWKYPSDSHWTTATSWRDDFPLQPLQVRTADDRLTLNPLNIFGNNTAVVAHRDEGELVGWGVEENGADIPPNIRLLKDIVQACNTQKAYAVRRANGEVHAWGEGQQGGDMGHVDPTGFTQLAGSNSAFAGLKNTGRVFSWGDTAVPAPISALTDLVRVVAAGYAFAAQRSNGQLVAWGGQAMPDEIGRLTDIKELWGNYDAFAGLRHTGQVVAWGGSLAGVVPDDIAAMTDLIELRSFDRAFIAKRKTGQIVGWGSSNADTIGPVIGKMTDIIDIAATFGAFAGLRSNGRVVAWGNTESGGRLPEEIAQLDDIVQMCGCLTAFAALRKNGTVVTWGNPDMVEKISLVADQLTEVHALYGSAQSFTALTADGRVVTWGYPRTGGDSSAVQHRLIGQVSYLATPASRGLALKARRLLETNAGTTTPSH